MNERSLWISSPVSFLTEVVNTYQNNFFAYSIVVGWLCWKESFWLPFKKSCSVVCSACNLCSSSWYLIGKRCQLVTVLDIHQFMVSTPLVFHVYLSILNIKSTNDNVLVLVHLQKQIKSALTYDIATKK